jgi:hypothetical protein
MSNRDRHLLLLLAAAALVFMLVDSALGLCDGALHLVPFFALLLPLLCECYLGEDVLDRLRGTIPRPARNRPLAVVAHRVTARWPSRLLGTWELASRPPPAGA